MPVISKAPILKNNKQVPDIAISPDLRSPSVVNSSQEDAKKIIGENNINKKKEAYKKSTTGKMKAKK